MDLALSLLGEEIEGDLTSRNIILDLNTGHNARVMFLPARSFIKILGKKNNSQYVGESPYRAGTRSRDYLIYRVSQRVLFHYALVPHYATGEE